MIAGIVADVCEENGTQETGEGTIVFSFVFNVQLF